MTVGEMLQRMSAREFAEWMAYHNIEPWGEQRADLRAGMIASPLVNMWMAKGSRRTKPSEWIMKFEPPEAQSPEEMKLLLQALAESMKAKKRT